MPRPRPEISLSSQLVTRWGLDAGLSAVGVTGIEVLEPARSVLTTRKAKGHASSMAFTYKNPERSTDPSLTLRNASSLVVGAMPYRQESASGAIESPGARVAMYAWGDAYATLRDSLSEVADRIREEGARARVVADQNDLVDRNVAYRAGLGWYGKNANLLLPGQGSWHVLGTIVTDARIEETGPPVADGCGSCDLCVSACPTGAIVGPGVVDARKCLAWLLQGPDPIPVEVRPAVGDRIYGCDECQIACPPNREAPVVIGQGSSDQTIPLDFLITASDEDLLERVGRWYIANRDPNVVRRSAMVVLGNTGDPNDPITLELLRVGLESDSKMVVEHARWAAAELGVET